MSLATAGRTGQAPARSASAGRPRRPYWTSRRRNQAAGLLFIAPQLIGTAVFVILPLLLVVWYSVHEWEVLAGSFEFVGAQNFQALATDDNMRGVTVATAIFSIGLVVFNLSLALTLALLLNQRFAGRVVFRTLFFSPVVVSVVAWAIVWNFLFQADGGINAALDLVGIDGPNWLRGGGTALFAVIIVQVFKNVGLNMVLFLAALQGVPGELYEAARIDGANRWQQFWRITFPMISPTVLLTSIITVIGSLQVFALIAVMTQGGPGTSTTVLVYYLFQQAFQFHKFGYGAALSLLLFVLVLALTLLQWQLRRKWVFHEE